MDIFVQLSGSAKRTVNMAHVLSLGIQQDSTDDGTVYYVAILMHGEVHIYSEPRDTPEEAEADLAYILSAVTYVSPRQP